MNAGENVYVILWTSSGNRSLGEISNDIQFTASPEKNVVREGDHHVVVAGNRNWQVHHAHWKVQATPAS
jgi:hypothetical protein